MARRRRSFRQTAAGEKVFSIRGIFAPAKSPGFGNLIYMIQMPMVFAGAATLLQTIGFGPVGARLPIVQGASFAFLPVMIPLVAGQGVATMGALMTGLIVLMIGLALIKVGIQDAAGGAPKIGAPDYGSLANWSVALVVIVVALALKFFARGMWSVAAALVGLLAGYAVAFAMGDVSFGNVARAAWFSPPESFRWGLDVSSAAILGFRRMAVVSAIETVGDVSGVTKGGAGREATDREITGASFANGLGAAIAGAFGALPNTSFSRNVGLIAMTGLMSRHVVTFGAIFLIVCGLAPKVGAAITTIPITVPGGGVIVMFGMVASAGVSMPSLADWNRRNLIIFAAALSVGLGLQLEPGALQHLSRTWRILLTSGLSPSAFIAIVLNLVPPQDLDTGDQPEEAREIAAEMKQMSAR